MSRFDIISLGLILGMASSASAQLAKNAPFSISIRAQQAIVRAGQPILVELTTKNIRRQSIRLGKTNTGIEIEYDFNVRDAHGEPVAEKESFKQVKHSGFVLSATSEMLKPQESIQEVFPISDYFDFTQAGLYSIQIQRPIPYSLGRGVVKSNVITVTVRLY